MVFGLNLHSMAPFAIPRTGFCMVFQRASFVLSCPGTDFGAQDWILDPQVDILARGPLLVNCRGPEKTEFAVKSFCGGLVGESLLPK